MTRFFRISQALTDAGTTYVTFCRITSKPPKMHCYNQCRGFRITYYKVLRSLHRVNCGSLSLIDRMAAIFDRNESTRHEYWNIHRPRDISVRRCLILRNLEMHRVSWSVLVFRFELMYLFKTRAVAVHTEHYEHESRKACSNIKPRLWLSFKSVTCRWKLILLSRT